MQHARPIWSNVVYMTRLTVNHDSFIKDLREQILLVEQAKKEGNMKKAGELRSVCDLLAGLVEVSAKEKNMLERKRTDYEICLETVNGIKDSWGENPTIQLALALQENLRQVDRHEGLRQELVVVSKRLKAELRF